MEILSVFQSSQKNKIIFIFLLFYGYILHQRILNTLKISLKEKLPDDVSYLLSTFNGA